MIRTVLISGALTEERLGQVAGELRRLATDTSRTDNLVVIINSAAGNSAAALRFIDDLSGSEHLKRLVELAEVKIYEAKSVATLLAFAFGGTRELSVQGKIGFDLGERVVQVGNPDHYEPEGRLAPQFMERWLAYRNAVLSLMHRLGLDADPDIETRFCGAEYHLELPAPECLRRGIINRIF